MKPPRLTEDPDIHPSLTGLEFVRAVQRCAGVTPHDEPVLTDDQLSFRLNYQRGVDEGWTNWAETGDWSAYLVAPTATGSFEVLFTRMPERSSIRSESSRAVFSSLSDATKFVMVNVLDSIRTKFGLDSLFIDFRRRGLDNRLVKARPEPSEGEPMAARIAPERMELIEQLQRISLAEDPSTYGVGFPGVEPYMNVIAMSFGEVASALVDALPADVMTCVDRFVNDHRE